MAKGTEGNENFELDLAKVSEAADKFAKLFDGDGGDERRKEWGERVATLVPFDAIPDGYRLIEFGKTGFPVAIPASLEAAERHFAGYKHTASGLTGVVGALAARATHGAETHRKALVGDNVAEQERAARALLTEGHNADAKAPVSVSEDELEGKTPAEIMALLVSRGAIAKK